MTTEISMRKSPTQEKKRRHMSKDEIRDQIIELVVKYGKKDRSELTLETSLIHDLGFKSANFFPLIAELEDIYDFDIQFAIFRSKKNIAEIVDFIAAQV